MIGGRKSEGDDKDVVRFAVVEDALVGDGAAGPRALSFPPTFCSNATHMLSVVPSSDGVGLTD